MTGYERSRTACAERAKQQEPVIHALHSPTAGQKETQLIQHVIGDPDHNRTNGNRESAAD